MTKTWLITGTSTGFGRELAEQLASQGKVNIVASARKPEELSYLDQYDHGQILKTKLDVTDATQIQSTVSEALAKFDSIDVLVNNAGLGYFATFEESDEKQTRYMFDVNFWGLVDMIRAVLPTMRKQRAGIVVNLSSIAGIKGTTALSFYNATKHAVEGVSKGLQAEVEPLGIKVMLVEPSAFRTDWSGRSSLKAISKIDDYKALSNQRIAGRSDDDHGQAGDPKIAAEIIIDQVENHSADLPLHLPLGNSAIDSGLKEFKQNAAEYKKYEDLARSADRPNE
ncbi:oxidoreductase [Lactobacillus sp. Sy-1]|uniref:oxidoreductase n=1 Tax=Lactobacillus sp. Sy-1 TaxID=2109645 RepID=UPI001C5AA650|nr:oxidoreductase [Lactobacillus sp. Sy-1]MBW1606430.1 SDR family NAD(P)-dependent oxidoreductase [Lactobacillus sp. Sy-1]